MIRVEGGGPPPGYRPCVGLMLLNRHGLILIGERCGPLRHAWQMPQGGIDEGEAPRAAAWRELREEVGTDRARLLAESRGWYRYDLPPDLAPAYWRGRWHGQAQKWFAFRFEGEDADIDLGTHKPEFSRWRWAPPDEVLALIVEFKRPVYVEVLQEFAHVLGPGQA